MTSYDFKMYSLKKNEKSDFYLKVRKIINDWDPIELMIHAPDDEYELEINQFYLDIEKCTIDELSEKIHKIFSNFFGETYKRNLSDCVTVSRKIMDLKNEINIT